MRTRLLLALTSCLCSVPVGPAHAQGDARAILDKAIKAHGGEEKLLELKAGRFKTKGKLAVGGGVEFTQEAAYQLPDKVREEVTLNVNGQQVKVVTVINGTRVSVEANGKKVPLTDALKEALKDVTALLQLNQLVPLRGTGYELSSLGEAKVNDKPAVGIRVSRKGARDVSLFFDKGTGLLTKVERRTVDPMSGQEFTEERVILEYRKVDGLPMASRVVLNRDGKPYAELDVMEAHRLKSIDDGEFNIE